MARANVETALPLDQWAEIFGFDLWYFNQFGKNVPTDKQESCPNIWYQYQWQRNYVSREEIAINIRRAENLLAQVLNYYPAERAIKSESVQFPRPLESERIPTLLRPDGRFKAIQVKYGEVHQTGALTRAEMDSAASVSVSDNDGDGLDETFTVTASNQYTDTNGDTVTVTDPAEVAVYYADGDRLGQPLDDTWRIRPVRVDINENTNQITITGHTAQLAKPDLLERHAPDSLDAKSAAARVSTVAVWHRFYNDDYGTATWDSYPHVKTGRTKDLKNPTITDPFLGLIRYDFSSELGTYTAPDRLTVNYVSGVLPDPDTGRIPRPWGEVIARLAAAFFPALTCGCQRTDQIVRYWRSPPNDDEFGGARPLTAGEVQSNPFGVSRGGIFAWQHVREARIL